MRDHIDETVEFLESQIRYHNNLYWNENNPEISDTEYDLLVEELREIDPENDVLIEMAERVHGEGVKHEVPMLSMDKQYSIEDILKWAKKTGEKEFILSPKMDGAACSLIYDKNGDMILASTRGDGLVGEDITAAVKEYVDIPLKIDNHFDKNIEVRGEAYMTLDEFSRLGLKDSNPRNLAAGTVKRKLDGHREYDHRNISFAAYNVLGINAEDEGEKFFHCHGWGIPTVPYIYSKLEDLENNLKIMIDNRDKLGFETDGIIISVSNVKVQERFGSTSHHPRYAISLKFQGESATTILKDIYLSISRTGVATPVAIVEPVILSGATITKASLHNVGFVLSKGFSKGATVMMTRRGGVIPHLEYVVKPGTELFRIPEELEGHKTYMDGDFLKIENPENSISVNIGKMRHFVKVMEIDGLGDSLIEKIIGDIAKTPDELYTIQVSDLLSLERMGKKSAENIVNSIQCSRLVPLQVFLRALGIFGLGKHVSRILAEGYKTLDDVMKISQEELEGIESFGPMIAHNVYHGLKDNQEYIKKLLKFITIEESKKAVVGNLTGKSFVFTGTLLEMNRNDAQKRVQGLGGETPSGVTKDLSYLVCGEKSEGSSKFKKATKINESGGRIEIISEKEFHAMIG